MADNSNAWFGNNPYSTQNMGMLQQQANNERASINQDMARRGISALSGGVPNSQNLNTFDYDLSETPQQRFARENPNYANNIAGKTPVGFRPARIGSTTQTGLTPSGGKVGTIGADGKTLNSFGQWVDPAQQARMDSLKFNTTGTGFI